MNRNRLTDNPNSNTATTSGQTILPFVATGGFTYPVMPTQQAFKRWFDRLRNRLRPEDGAPCVAAERLHAAKITLLDRLVAPPPTADQLAELDLSLHDWLLDDAPASWLKLIILPPCDETDLISTWARSKSLTVLDAPARKALTAEQTPRLASLADVARPLAAKSLGIPWVAWHLWRCSLRDLDRLDDPAEQTRDDPTKHKAPLEQAPATTESGALTAGRETHWIATLDVMLLPDGPDQGALLVLHALLIHGSLSAETLCTELPGTLKPNAVAMLRRAGFIEVHEGVLKCRAAAYPAVREALGAAGFPLDKL